MSDPEPIKLTPRGSRFPAPQAAGSGQLNGSAPSVPAALFTRSELDQILTVYGRKVAAGEWRDYAIDFGADKAVFSVYRRSSEYPLYRIEKCPRLGRRQGAYSVVAQTGLILKRGHDLSRVLEVLEKRVRLVDH